MYLSFLKNGISVESHSDRICGSTAFSKEILFEKPQTCASEQKFKQRRQQGFTRIPFEGIEMVRQDEPLWYVQYLTLSAEYRSKQGLVRMRKVPVPRDFRAPSLLILFSTCSLKNLPNVILK